MHSPYLSYNSYNLADLEALKENLRRILIVERDRELCQLYGTYLEHMPVDVKVCYEPDLFHASVYAFMPNISIVDADILLGVSASDNRTMKARHPQMHIIAIGGTLARETLHELMDLGVSSYINRTITRPHHMASAVADILSIVF